MGGVDKRNAKLNLFPLSIVVELLSQETLALLLNLEKKIEKEKLSSKDITFLDKYNLELTGSKH